MNALRITFAAAVFVASFPPPSRAGVPSEDGEWTQPFSLPLIAMHAAMLPTGKVLLFSAEHGVPGIQCFLLNPVTLTTTAVPIPTNWNLSCSGHSFLADGRLLVTGGQIRDDPPQGPKLAHLFNPFTEQWTRIEDMRAGRWYPSNITLGDGRVVTFTGLDEFGRFNPYIELWDPNGTNNWELLGQKFLEYYPYLHLLTNGLVFRSGPDGATETYNPGNNVWTPVATRNVTARFEAPSVMLPPNPNRIMVMGGFTRTNQPYSSAEIIDLSSPSPHWTAIAPMNFARTEFSAAILPSGKIFVVGGRSNYGTTPIFVMTPEIFDPQTLTWDMVAPHQIPRGYHSTAILLPDARVLVAGSNDHPSGEIYSPPYLFQGSRPVIQSAPSVIRYGESFNVSFTSATTNNRVALIRFSCMTHSVNMDQRYVRIADLTNGGGTFSVPAPATSNLAPPGYYMLYVIDQNGVPSVSATVQVLPAGPEQLRILEIRSAGSGGIQLFWSLAFSNVTVEGTDSLLPPRTWSPQPGTPTIQEGRYTITLPAASRATFFRLSSP